jgi:hypothetical protein
MEHMYKGPQFAEVQKDKCKGFSLYNRLEDIEVDRTDIENKIANNYFDAVIIGMHHSNAHDQTAMGERQMRIAMHYPANRIAVIDGFDGQKPVTRLSPNVTYFKREIGNDPPVGNIHPICFSIPKENIVDSIPHKIRTMAPLIPAYMEEQNYSTYIYDTEEDYNQMYQESMFGLTWKKGGWDCLRHYEILANGCVPLFTDIDVCPDNTMVIFPKRLCRVAMGLSGIEVHQNGIKITRQLDVGAYLALAEELLEYTTEWLTTAAVSDYLIGALWSQK